MDINAVKPGMQCTVSDGSLVDVIAVQPDNIHVRVRYVDNMDNPDIKLGEERDLPFEELIGVYQGTHAEGLT
jgi:hypothetical protein